MELAEPIYGNAGQLLLQPGVALTQRYISRLRMEGVPAVYIQDADTTDVVAPRPIRQQTRIAARRELAAVIGNLTPFAPELRELSLSLTRQHVSTDRFAQAVRSAFGNGAFSAIENVADAIVGDLLNESVLSGLNSIKTHDAYTYQHSIDVTIMGVVLARKAGWDAERIRTFGIGCLLHDLGKVLIPPEILNKPDRLTDVEFEQVKAHPLLGYQMIRAIGSDRYGLIAQVAYQHHERQDGSGYPRSLKGSNVLGHHPGLIHDFGAISAVADVYDAMSSMRPYRGAWAPDRVVASIADWAGTQFNSQVVEIFLSVVTPYPLCSEVIFITGPHRGCRGVVTKVDPARPNQPSVRILYSAAGTRLEPIDVNLAIEQDMQIRSGHADPIIIAA